MYKTLTTVSSVIVTIILSVVIVVAQTSCDALLEEALIALEDNCEETGRNEACYGFDQVEAAFLSEIDEATFAQPSDIALVADLETLRTSPLSVDNGTWGVAIMNLQANIPNTLPGQTVTFVLMGDVEVENAVDPDTAFNPNDGIDVSIISEAGVNIRSGPGLNFNVIGGGAFNDVLIADGLSEDGEWVRIAYRNRPAWVSRGLVASEDTIEDLPTLTPELNTPMQSFYLRTGIGQPSCAEIPDDLLLVQGPENIEIELTVNGADITLGSSGALRIIEINGELFLEIIVFDGEFTVDEQTIRAGQRSLLCLGDGENLGLDGEANDLTVTCEASVPETIPSDEFGEIWCVMEDVPSDVLNYGLEILCPGETPPPVTTVNTGSTATTTTTTGTTGCASFSIPQQNVVASNFVIEWNDVAGADNYIVAVFNEADVEYLTIPVTDSRLATNGGGWSGSGYIDVRAYNGAEYLCFARMTYTRAADPNETPPDTGEFGFNFSCSFSYSTYASSVTVNYAGADSGETITLEIKDNNTTPTFIDSSSTTGSTGSLTASIGSASTPYVGEIKITVTRSSTGEEFIRTCITSY